MKIGYFSDLHTEFMRPDVIAAGQRHESKSKRPIGLETFGKMLAEAYQKADVIVAAGDIGTHEKGIHFLQDAFGDKPVIFVPGNHDHWGAEYYSNLQKMRQAAVDSNVHFFHDGGTIEIGGVLFCAGTLWTDYALVDDAERNMEKSQSYMSDYHYIEVAPRKYIAVQSTKCAAMDFKSTLNNITKIRARRNNGMVINRLGFSRRINPSDFREYHRITLRNIQLAMKNAYESGKKLVVVTHHAPSRISLLRGDEFEADYVFQKSDPSYASNLDYQFEGEDAPALWIHGHTHIATAYTTEGGKTRVVSNPKGYSMGDDTGWEMGRLEEI